MCRKNAECILCYVYLKLTYIAGDMSALLGMQDRNRVRLHVISLGNIFQPLVFVVTLWINSKV